MKRIAYVAATLVGVLAVAGALVGFARSSSTRVVANVASLQAQYVGVVKKVSQSVVQIETNEGLGSGVIFDRKGNIVTNAHVVGSAETFKVTFANGKTAQARLVGTFVAGDLAVIRVNGATAGLRPAAFAVSRNAQVGEIVLAIGNPLGFSSSVTDGIISAFRPAVPEGNGAALSNAIQTSAPINPGNSGGALVDLNSRVVGIPTLAAANPQVGTAAAGIGFAIPSDTVRLIAPQLIASGKVTSSGRAYLGVRLGETVGAPGPVVGTVDAGTPAARAGIRGGDIIVSIAGRATPSVSDLSAVLAALKPGQAVKVALVRADGTKTTLAVTLGELPGS